MALAKEQIRQIISNNDLTRVSDMYPLPKDGFKDILSITIGANEFFHPIKCF